MGLLLPVQAAVVVYTSRVPQIPAELPVLVVTGPIVQQMLVKHVTRLAQPVLMQSIAQYAPPTLPSFTNKLVIKTLVQPEHTSM